MDTNLTNISLFSTNIGLNLTNALFAIVSSFVILILDHLLKSRLTKRKDDIWIKFLKSDKYIRKCIQDYENIKSPELIEQLKAEILGILSSSALYLSFNIIILIIIVSFGSKLFPYAFSTFIISLISFIISLRISRRINKPERNQDLLRDSERIARNMIFINWFTITGILNGIFINPFSINKIYPSVGVQ